MNKTWLLIFYSLFAGQLLHAQTTADTIKLYFATGDANLSARSRSYLDSLFYYDVILPNQTVSIIGYTDYVGDKSYNESLSQQRAKQVASYFTGMGVPANRIRYLKGMGEVAREKEMAGGYQADRRVDVVLKMRSATATKRQGKIIARIDEPVSRPNPISNMVEATKPGGTLVLNKIYFYAGRHAVKPESIPELDNLYQVLRVNSNLKIGIEGHVCCVRNAPDALDEDTFEMALSTNRAKFIYEYLIDKGIDAERLKYVGFGRMRPVVIHERTLDDEDKNRRVEIRVLSK